MQFQECQRQQLGKGSMSQKRMGLCAAMHIATPRKKKTIIDVSWHSEAMPRNAIQWFGIAAISHMRLLLLGSTRNVHASGNAAGMRKTPVFAIVQKFRDRELNPGLLRDRQKY